MRMWNSMLVAAGLAFASAAQAQEVISMPVGCGNGSCGCGASCGCGSGGYCGDGPCRVSRLWQWATYRPCNHAYVGGCSECYPPRYAFFECRGGACNADAGCGNNCGFSLGRLRPAATCGSCNTCSHGLFGRLFGCGVCAQGGSHYSGCETTCSPGTVPYHPTTYKAKLVGTCGPRYATGCTTCGN